METDSAAVKPLAQLFGGKRAKKQAAEAAVPDGMRCNGIFYIRVSTDKQEERGNGLEAQKDMILDFARKEKIHQIHDFYVETVSGGKPLEKRPVLSAVIDLAKKYEAYVVVAKLDRLSRNAAMVCNMLEDNFKFVTAEYGFESEAMMLRIIAAVAQKERELIGERTKKGLEQVKKRYEEDYKRQLAAGVENPVKKRLGIPDVSKAPTHISHIRRKEGQERSRKYVETLINPVIEELRKEKRGRKPNRKEIAERMNEKGYRTDYGSLWTENSIYHAYKKAKLEEAGDSKSDVAPGDSVSTIDYDRIKEAEEKAEARLREIRALERELHLLRKNRPTAAEEATRDESRHREEPVKASEPDMVRRPSESGSSESPELPVDSHEAESHEASSCEDESPEPEASDKSFCDAQSDKSCSHHSEDEDQDDDEVYEEFFEETFGD